MSRSLEVQRGLKRSAVISFETLARSGLLDTQALTIVSTLGPGEKVLVSGVSVSRRCASGWFPSEIEVLCDTLRFVANVLGARTSEELVEELQKELDKLRERAAEPPAFRNESLGGKHSHTAWSRRVRAAASRLRATEVVLRRARKHLP